MPFAPHGAAVAVEGSHAHQCGDLTTVQGAQLGQVGQQREGELLTHAGNGAQEVVLLPATPDSAGASVAGLGQGRLDPAPTR